AGHGPVREGVARDKVFITDFCWVHPQALGHSIHDALHNQVGGLFSVPSGSVPGAFVGDYSRKLDIYVLDCIATRQCQASEENHSPAGRSVRCTNIAHQVVFESQDPSVAIEGKLKMMDLLSSADQQAILPILHPFDRPTS